MNNTKIYFIWIFLNTLYLVEVVYYIHRLGFCWGLSFLFGIVGQMVFYLICSWKESICRFFFWKINGFQMILIRLYPFCIDLSMDSIQIKFDRGIGEFGNIYVLPKVRIRRINKLISENNRLTKISKYSNYLLYFLIIGVSTYSSKYLGVAVLTLIVSTEFFLQMSSDMMFLGSWRAAEKTNQLSGEIFYSIVLERIESDEKNLIYEYMWEVLSINENMSNRKRQAIEGCIIDSICDGRDYVSNEILDKIVNICNRNEISNEPIYNRVAILLNLYMNYFHKDYGYYYNGSGELGNNIMWNTILRRKINSLLEFDYKAVMDYRNNSLAFQKKLERIKNYEK